jgi:hypothetical protein
VVSGVYIAFRARYILIISRIFILTALNVYISRAYLSESFDFIGSFFEIYAFSYIAFCLSLYADRYNNKGKGYFPIIKTFFGFFSLIYYGLLSISSLIVNSIFFFKRFNSAECKYLFRDTVYTLNLYYYSAAVKLIIDKLIFFTVFIISF